MFIFLYTDTPYFTNSHIMRPEKLWIYLLKIKLNQISKIIFLVKFFGFMKTLSNLKKV